VDACEWGRRPSHPGLDLAALNRTSPRILVVNAGSTSLKLSTVEADGASTRYGSLDDVPPDVVAVGHRVVHGGRHFGAVALLTADAVEEIGELASLAPLHTEPALRGIAAARDAFPDAPHLAVFDSAFHATMPAEASTYAVPVRWREEWGIRRYGFHGLAVASVAERVHARHLVVCHLGGGCSVTAVLDGRSVDTTMGFSPLEGVPMATRSGSVDPGALLYLLREHGLTPDELDHALEHESGLRALGGLDDHLGFGVYTYRIAQAVAAMTAALGGLDALAFSGGVGENREDVRRAIVERLRYLGDFRVDVVEAREDVVVARSVRQLLDR
jgi:acetate kinase